jgi:hypothetical protein
MKIFGRDIECLGYFNNEIAYISQWTGTVFPWPETSNTTSFCAPCMQGISQIWREYVSDILMLTWVISGPVAQEASKIEITRTIGIDNFIEEAFSKPTAAFEWLFGRRVGCSVPSPGHCIPRDTLSREGSSHAARVTPSLA